MNKVANILESYVHALNATQSPQILVANIRQKLNEY